MFSDLDVGGIQEDKTLSLAWQQQDMFSDLDVGEYKKTRPSLCSMAVRDYAWQSSLISVLSYKDVGEYEPHGKVG